MTNVFALLMMVAVTVGVAYAVGRMEIGQGMGTATVEVARSAPSYWIRPPVKLPQKSTPVVVDYVVPEQPKRWAWSAFDPQLTARAAAMPPAALPASPAPATKVSAPVAAPSSKFEIWDGDQRWEG